MVDPLNPQALGGLLKRGAAFDLGTFQGRLVFQKTVYIWKSFGVPIGYPFNWYVRGPYSPALTSAGFQIKDGMDRLPPVRFVDPKAEKAFEEALQFVSPHRTDARWLEVVASIHFLVGLKPRPKREEIFQMIATKMRVHPRLGRAEFDRAWSDLAQSRAGRELDLVT